MAEVPFTREDHGDSVFVGRGDHFVVADTSTRLYHSCDPRRCCGIESVAEREECVTGCDATIGAAG